MFWCIYHVFLCFWCVSDLCLTCFDQYMICIGPAVIWCGLWRILTFERALTFFGNVLNTNWMYFDVCWACIWRVLIYLCTCIGRVLAFLGFVLTYFDVFDVLDFNLHCGVVHILTSFGRTFEQFWTCFFIPEKMSHRVSGTVHTRHGHSDNKYRPVPTTCWKDIKVGWHPSVLGHHRGRSEVIWHLENISIISFTVLDTRHLKNKLLNIFILITIFLAQHAYYKL